MPTIKLTASFVASAMPEEGAERVIHWDASSLRGSA